MRGSEVDAYHWDARWGPDERSEALALARNRLNAEMLALEAASAKVATAADWYSSVCFFNAAATKREVEGEVA